MMRSFNAFLQEEVFLVESKNTHLEHIEDMVLNKGVAGTKQALDFLRYTRNALAGHSKNKVNLSMKIDGAPAIFAGIDPSDGQFFVAKKGIFNKSPKVYKTFEDLDQDNLPPDLANKMKIALKHLPELGIKGVIQGDFLYSSDTIKRATIDGVKYLTFHPNTIVYAVPADSELARKIKMSKIGIVWHTTYSGNSFENMKAVFNQPIVHKLNNSRAVWSTDVVHKDFSGITTMTVDETKQFSDLFSKIGVLFNKIPASVFNGPSADSDLLIRMKAFDNSKVRDRQRIGNAQQHVKQMVSYIHDWYQKKIDSVSTEKSKQTWTDKRTTVMKYFANNDINKIALMYELINLLVEAKELILKKLNEIKHLNTFLLTKKGFITTGHEGFVVSDHFGDNGMKLVDRLEFSFANFSPEVLKGFDIRK